MDQAVNRSELRRYPIGAEWTGDGVSFRIWAPAHRKASVVIEGGSAHEMDREADGYFSVHVPQAAPGTLYRFRLGRDDTLYPDPASRFQPDGPHGPSQVTDPHAFRWSDSAWRGVGMKGQVISEIHIGTFTPEGTWEAATARLPALKDVGITLVELMPVADYPGRFGWGYDGVNFFAPCRLYGQPDEFRRFVNEAHRLGMGVLLDVVYNHFGPDGNYTFCFTRDYVSDRYENEWGEAINFDGPNSGPVREFFITNAAYWIDEFHLDGLRLDATQALFDKSDEHIITALARSARKAAGERSILVIAENEPQSAGLMRPPESGGCGLDGVWADDFHHAAMVALTGHNEAYYSDTSGSPQEFVSAAKYGYLYQGQYYTWHKRPRGTPAFDIPIERFANFLQNHDQIANSGRGLRFHHLTSPGRARAMTALLLLMPTTPILFQGQEFFASSPFMFFADQKGEIAEGIRKGRAEFVAQFPSLATPEVQAVLPDATDPEIFLASKLDWSERERHSEALALHRDLLRLRRDDPAFSAQHDARLDGAVLGPEAFALRYFGPGDEDRLLLVNLGRDLPLATMAEPLLAPPAGSNWKLLFSSESLAYGGCGAVMDLNGRWRLQGNAATVLATDKFDD